MNTNNKPVKLSEAPTGIFKSEHGNYGFKSEYLRSDRSIEAYCLGSGEAWWGDGIQTVDDQHNQLVYPINFYEISERLEAAETTIDNAMRLGRGETISVQQPHHPLLSIVAGNRQSLLELANKQYSTPRTKKDWQIIRALFRPAFSRMGGSLCDDSDRSYRAWRSTCLLAFIAGLAALDPYWNKYV